MSVTRLELTDALNVVRKHQAYQYRYVLAKAKEFIRNKNNEKRMNIKKILQWPQTETNDIKPLWLILWGLLFCPMIYGGKVFSFIGLIFAAGINEAVRFWKESYI